MYSMIEAIWYQWENKEMLIKEKEFSSKAEHPDSYYLDEEGHCQARVSVFSGVRRIREQRWNLVKSYD